MRESQVEKRKFPSKACPDPTHPSTAALGGDDPIATPYIWGSLWTGGGLSGRAESQAKLCQLNSELIESFAAQEHGVINKDDARSKSLGRHFQPSGRLLLGIPRTARRRQQLLLALTQGGLFMGDTKSHGMTQPW